MINSFGSHRGEKHCHHMPFAINTVVISSFQEILLDCCLCANSGPGSSLIKTDGYQAGLFSGATAMSHECHGLRRRNGGSSFAWEAAISESFSKSVPKFGSRDAASHCQVHLSLPAWRRTGRCAQMSPLIYSWLYCNAASEPAIFVHLCKSRA